MLKTEPEQRPSADYVHEIIQKHQNQFLKAKQNDFLNDTQGLNKNSNKKDASNNIELTKQNNEIKQNVYSTIYCFDKENVTLSVIPTKVTSVKVKQVLLFLIKL